MSFGTIDTQYVVDFKDSFALVSQQINSRFSPYVTVKTGYQGKLVSPIELLAKSTPTERTLRLQATPERAISVDRRWLEPRTFDDAVQVDSMDVLQRLSDPSNMITQGMVAGFNTQEDKVIIEAIFGTNKTGELGADSTVFDPAQVVAAGGVGMTIAKLKAGVTILKKNDVNIDMETPTLFLSPDEEAALISEDTVASSDYVRGYANETGKLPKLYGCNIVVTNLLPEVGGAGTDRQCPLFVKSGVCLGKWADKKARITELDNKNYATQIWMEYVIGASRLEEAKVVSIECTVA